MMIAGAPMVCVTVGTAPAPIEMWMLIGGAAGTAIGVAGAAPTTEDATSGSNFGRERNAYGRLSVYAGLNSVRTSGWVETAVPLLDSDFMIALTRIPRLLT